MVAARKSHDGRRFDVCDTTVSGEVREYTPGALGAAHQDHRQLYARAGLTRRALTIAAQRVFHACARAIWFMAA